MTRRFRTLLLIAAATAAAVVGTTPAVAQGPTGSAPAAPAAAASAPPIATPSGPGWRALTTAQRTILAPLERDWDTIDAPRKSKWLEVASRFPAMRAADQQRVQERMAEWAHMTPAERGRARLSFQESKQFSPEQKQARWEAYQALPDAERKALAIRSKPAEERPRSTQSPLAGTAAPAAKPMAGPKPAASAPFSKPVAPTVVQAKPGATTTLMTTPVVPPEHHRPGQPKIAAKPGQVNPTTLLPQSGPQAAASAAVRRP